MKKLVTLALVGIALLGASSKMNAQVFDVGTKHLNIGIGFGGTYFGYVYTGGSDYSQIPTIFISYDQGTDWELGPGIIGIGGFLGYSSAKAEYNYGSGYMYSWSWTNMVVGGRATYHFPIDADKLDLYGGLSLGLWIQSYEYKDTDPFWNGSLDLKETYTNLYYAGCVGARFMFSDSFGAFAELGWDIALLKAGVTIGL